MVTSMILVNSLDMFFAQCFGPEISFMMLIFLNKYKRAYAILWIYLFPRKSYNRRKFLHPDHLPRHLVQNLYRNRQDQ